MKAEIRPVKEAWCWQLFLCHVADSLKAVELECVWSAFPQHSSLHLAFPETQLPPSVNSASVSGGSVLESSVSPRSWETVHHAPPWQIVPGSFL